MKFFSNFKSKKTNHFFIENVNSQFYEILNNTQNYIVKINEFKNLVYLDCFIQHSNNAFNELIQNINDAILKKKQIVFEEFCLTWWNPQTGIFTNYPMLINDKNLLSQNIAIYDPFNSDQIDVIKSFTSLNRLINFEMKYQDLHLLLTNEIMISYSKDNGYFLLFSKDVIQNEKL